MRLDHNTNLILINSLKYSHHHDTGCPQWEGIHGLNIDEAHCSLQISFCWLLSFYTLCWALLYTFAPCWSGLVRVEFTLFFFFPPNNLEKVVYTIHLLI